MRKKFLLSAEHVANETLSVASRNYVKSKNEYEFPSYDGYAFVRASDEYCNCMIIFRKTVGEINICGDFTVFKMKDLSLSLDAFSKKYIEPLIKRVSYETPYFDGVFPI